MSDFNSFDELFDKLEEDMLSVVNNELKEETEETLHGFSKDIGEMYPNKTWENRYDRNPNDEDAFENRRNIVSDLYKDRNEITLETYNIAKGDYAAAADNLKGMNNNMAALAQILNKDYESARVIFKQMADVILKGGTPYLDLNDNKGVLLYALYAVGQSIPNSKVGVFLICAVLFYISVFYWSKISQLLLPQSNQRWMVLWIGICFYTILQKLGGLTEDICLPICSYALYIGIRMVYTDQPLSKRHSFVLGLLFAILVFIRLNNIAYVIAPLLWAGGRKWKEKKRQEIPSLIGFFLLGGISVAFVIYGVMYGCYGWTGIASMTNSMFLSLLRYQGLDYTPDLLLQTVNIGIQLLFFGAALMFIKGMKASERMVLRFAFVLSILNMVCLGKHFYSHYFILFVPLYFLLACLFTKYANTTIRSALILLLLFPFAYKTHNVCRMLICEDQIHEEEFYRATDEMVNVIPMEDRNQVFNYG